MPALPLGSRLLLPRRRPFQIAPRLFANLCRFCRTRVVARVVGPPPLRIEVTILTTSALLNLSLRARHRRVAYYRRDAQRPLTERKPCPRQEEMVCRKPPESSKRSSS